MSGRARRPFDLTEPLPRSRLAIQASAGTGKTFTLAALATRFVAERNVAASELLVVTFTRAAAAELRSRLRERLVEAAAALEPVVGGPVGPAPVGPVGGMASGRRPDPVLAYLASEDRGRRWSRLERAVTEFDAATITTIHGFAAQVLGVLGATAGTDPDAVLVDDARELVGEACADVLARAATEGPPDLLPSFEDLRRAVDTAVRIPDLRLVPEPGQEGAGPVELRRAELVRRVLGVLADRRRQAGTLGFDDLLAELRRALSGPGRAAAIQAVRSRFKVALIDEFQDTDPVQWDILSTLFGDGSDGTTLVLVGDPKQAIYSFRGADVRTYLAAVTGGELRSLDTNWRSDGTALGALEVLLGGATFGEETIGFTPVSAAEANRDRRLRAAGEGLPSLVLRLALGSDLARTKRRPNDIVTSEAERAIAGDLVAQVRALLEEARIPVDDRPGRPAGTDRAVRPSDIAVLVRSSREAEWVQAALAAGGVPAVVARGGSVLASSAADQWRWLLEALLRPSDPARARLFALSWFGGRSPDWVAAAGDDDDLAQVQEQLVSWAGTLADSGIVELVRRVWSETLVVSRVLARPDGDRDVTDLGHIGELLQRAAEGTASVAALLAALDSEMSLDADAEVEADVAARRVESEAEAVQVMSVWVAKGLEFPIVCCPTLWRKPLEPAVIYQDPDLGRRTYDVSGAGSWPDPSAAAARKRLAGAESLGENLRLLYVALTRARHQTIVWWTRAQGSDTTALAHVLFARKAGEIDPTGYYEARVSLPPDAEAAGALRSLVERSGGAIAVAAHGAVARSPRPWVDPLGSPAAATMRVATLDRLPDRSASRWSFTAMTSGAEPAPIDPYDHSLADGGASDEREPGGLNPDEGAVGEGRAGAGRLAEGPTGVAGARIAPGGALAALPAGTGFGTLVHAVLEEADFAAPDLDGQLATAIDRQLRWRGLDLTPPGVAGATPGDGRRLLVEGLGAVVDTPLGPLLDGRRLRDVAPADHLDELPFELLLGGSGPPPSDRDIGQLVLDRLPAGDPFEDWAAGLADGALGVELAGHLTGSIDAVLRLRSPSERYVVVDYKTNRLHRAGAPPAPDDYHPERLAAAMVEHHYPLQALLYSVALHRYLRWRLRGYEPSVHLAGAAYLFVRGMTGPEVAVSDGLPHGVFAWAVPPTLVTDLSDLLAERRVGAA